VSTPRFLVSPDALCGGTAILTGTELHHLRVRRLRMGSGLILSDGAGRERAGTVAALDRHRAIVRFDTATAQTDARHRRLVLAQAFLKANKFDWIIEKSTELGVDEVLCFHSERSVGDPSPARQARWSRIARAAAKQCQRSTVPRIAGPITFDELLERSDAIRLFFWEGTSSGSLSANDSPLGESVLAVVGPEGGFTMAEATRAANHGFRLVKLGPRTLRAETAAVVAASLCQFLWGDLTEPIQGVQSE
jgi:16S rRNA (uracil1498-N3)-methyltransferase